MSRWIDPQRYIGRVEGISQRDGTKGYLVTKHLTIWSLVPCAVLLTSALTAWCYLRGWINASVVVAVVGGLGAWALHWWISQTYLVVTRIAVYHHMIRKLERDTDKYLQKHIQQARALPEGLNILRSKRVTVTTAGTAPNLTYRHAGGGDELSTAINELT